MAYLRGWADAHDIWYLSQRPVLHRSPALAECARRALDSAGVTMDDVAGLDLYACFPSSVEVARDSFAIAAADLLPLTLTGGLPYHGGPGSNYVTHSIANTAQWLRSGQGEHALVHGGIGTPGLVTLRRVVLTTRNGQAPVPPEKLQEHIAALRSPPVVETVTWPLATVTTTSPPPPSTATARRRRRSASSTWVGSAPSPSPTPS